jgi:hypothetical protein
MEVAEPLLIVYLVTVQEMVAIPHHFTPCCTLVAPCLCLRTVQLSTLVLVYPSMSPNAVQLAPYTMHVVCGYHSPHTHKSQRYIMCLSSSHIIYISKFQNITMFQKLSSLAQVITIIVIS